jgi:large subunit ribosomal protein L7/L12
VAKQEVNIDELVGMLNNLSVLDLNKLKKALENEWDVKPAIGGSVVMAASSENSGKVDAEKEEATNFKVTLEEVPSDKKISVIKAIREITSFGLKEVREFVEGAPKVIKDNVPKVEAEEIKKKLVDSGAKVSLIGI